MLTLGSVVLALEAAGFDSSLASVVAGAGAASVAGVAAVSV